MCYRKRRRNSRYRRERVQDPKYLHLRKQIIKFPNKYNEWKVEEEWIYKFRYNELLDPITEGDGS